MSRLSIGDRVRHHDGATGVVRALSETSARVEWDASSQATWVITSALKRKRGQPPKIDGRTKQIVIRLTAAEHAEIERLAAQALVSVSEYVRGAALPSGAPQNERLPPPTPEDG